jgi:c-di-GMP-binding flagellar brake protein YcgR
MLNESASHRRFNQLVNNAPQSCRRQHRRAALEIPVVLIATAYGTTSIASARSCDLSEGGMRLVATTGLREHQSVSVEFKASNDASVLKLYGQVRYSDAVACGIQFITPSEEQRKEIRNLLMN